MEQSKLDKITGPDEQVQSEQAQREIDLDGELSEDELENTTGGIVKRITNVRANTNQIGVSSTLVLTQIVA